MSYKTKEFSSASGKTTSDYSHSLAIHTGLEGDYPFFSGSVLAGYSKEEQQSLCYVYTRITYLVTHYSISLPPPLATRELIRDDFKTILDAADPTELYEEYGTHLVQSIVLGGRAVFTSSTDIRKYSSSESIEGAAKMALKFSVPSMNADMSTKDQNTAKSFNSASQTKVTTCRHTSFLNVI